MKAIQSLRQFLPVVIFSFIMMATSLEASSQNHRNENKSNKNNDRKEYRNDRSNSSNHSVARNDGRNGDRKHYSVRSSDRNNGNYAYDRHNSGRGYNDHQQAYTTHPRYSRVYQRFEHTPYVFRHSHGNYYYSDNQFYTYRDGIGYCVSEAPRDVYFNELPFECSRVNINGRVFFRNGDLYFSHSSRGYVIVPAPLAINLSLRF